MTDGDGNEKDPSGAVAEGIRRPPTSARTRAAGIRRGRTGPTRARGVRARRGRRGRGRDRRRERGARARPGGRVRKPSTSAPGSRVARRKPGCRCASAVGSGRRGDAPLVTQDETLHVETEEGRRVEGRRTGGSATGRGEREAARRASTRERCTSANPKSSSRRAATETRDADRATGARGALDAGGTGQHRVPARFAAHLGYSECRGDVRAAERGIPEARSERLEDAANLPRVVGPARV